MRLLTVLGITILLSSCATSMNNYYKPTVQSWQGGSINNLTARWGKPDRMISTQDKTYYMYESENVSASSTPSYPAVGLHVDKNGRAEMISSPASNMTWNRGSLSITCMALFEVNASGKILSTKVQGNNCYMGEGAANRKVNPDNVQALGKAN